MVDLRQVSWLKYVIVLIVAVIAGYVLPPSTWADSPGRIEFSAYDKGATNIVSGLPSIPKYRILGFALGAGKMGYA